MAATAEQSKQATTNSDDQSPVRDDTKDKDNDGTEDQKEEQKELQEPPDYEDKSSVYVPVASSSGNDNMTSESMRRSNQVISDDDVNGNLPDIVKFINDTFQKRTCKRVVQKKDSLCCCGYAEADHSDDAKQNDNSGTWHVDNDTELNPTDAFGDVEFATLGQKISKYIRVNYKTSVKDLMTLMLDHWQMESPNLLISVTGGAQNFTMKPRLREVFRQGLVKAAESTRAWIITGGTNAGVMKHVGEALRDYAIKYGSKKQLVALGIATWGCIENKKDLISDPLKDASGKVKYGGCWPAPYKVSESSVKKKESPLDPNHTHFILVDDGTQQLFGAEIAIRTELESEISRRKTTEEAVSIPVVCVVLEGGPNTLDTVKTAIDRGTPAIIVAGSGRAADILAFAYENCHKEVDLEDKLNQKATKVTYDNSLWDEVGKRIREEFKKDNESDIKKWVAMVKSCIDKIDYLTVFRLEGGSSAGDIDVTILRALLKVNRGERLNQMRLALAWNRVDVAKDEIFTEGVSFEDSDLKTLMFSAIVNNRVEFVKLFLDKGLILKEFLSIQRFQALYNHPLTSQRCRQLKRMTKKGKRTIVVKDVGTLMKELNGEVFEPIYCGPKFRTETRETSVDIALHSVSPLPKKTEEFDEPSSDLFLWSILTQHREMAMVFWYESKEDLPLAVLAHLLLKTLLDKDPDPELNQELSEQVSYYEDLAVGLLSECHSSDQRKTADLLVRELPTFGNTTVLKMAVEADNKNFVAHPACQNFLTEVWTGNLSDDNHYIKLLLTSFCPFLAPVWLKYREKEIKQTMERSTSTTITRRNQSSAGLVKTDSQADYLNGQATSTTAKGSSGASPKRVASYFKKLGFFFRAPVIKFCYSCMTYFAFLLLFGIILLTDFYPTIGIKEKILIAWVFTLIFEEIRQIAMDDAGDIRRKLYNYITDIWNKIDVITIVTFLAGMILRFIPVSICGQCFYAARIVLALNFMTFFFRILHMFSIHRQLGPKLVMIGKMMIDLFYFMIILLVFIAAYGIASHVILYPNQPLNIALARDVLSRSWWNIFGELGIDVVSGQACNNATALPYAEQCASMDFDEYSASGCSDYKEQECPSIEWLVPIILAIYVLITNVLMLNLLIAMFSNTFSNIQGQTDVVWKMQRYYLVHEYESRPMLPPPLIIFAHIFLFIRYVIRHCCPNDKCFTKHDSKFRLTFKPQSSEEKELLNWENVNAEEYLRKRGTNESDTTDNKAPDATDKMDEILQRLERLDAVERRLEQIAKILGVNDIASS